MCLHGLAYTHSYNLQTCTENGQVCTRFVLFPNTNIKGQRARVVLNPAKKYLPTYQYPENVARACAPLWKSIGKQVYVITPFGVVLLIYPPDTRGRVVPEGRADKPQHHDKRCDKMFITVDWSLRGRALPNKAMHVIPTSRSSDQGCYGGGFSYGLERLLFTA